MMYLLSLSTPFTHSVLISDQHWNQPTAWARIERLISIDEMPPWNQRKCFIIIIMIIIIYIFLFVCFCRRVGSLEFDTNDASLLKGKIFIHTCISTFFLFSEWNSFSFHFENNNIIINELLPNTFSRAELCIVEHLFRWWMNHFSKVKGMRFHSRIFFRFSLMNLLQ